MSEEFPTPQLIDDLENHGDSSNTRIIKDLVSGTAGGMAQVLVGQPFDTTKVRLQTSTGNVSAKTVVRNLLQHEGVLGFYKGTLTPLVGVGACVSIQFGVNEFMKRFFHSKNTDPKSTLYLYQYYLCGLTGGFANSFLAAPIEHVRIRLQTQTSQPASKLAFKGPLDCFSKLKRHHSLMRGLSPTILREGHGCGTYFLTYEALIAREVKQGIQRVDIPTWKLCLFGALSGTSLWITIYPLDVIKTVMQTDLLGKPKLGNSMSSVAKGLYRRDGYIAFLKGFGPTMMRAAPANAATFATFELMMRLLG